jgi:hypothetical protein
MSCLIKNIPSQAFLIQGTGNRGHGFPIVLECGLIPQPISEDCYLALEIDPVGSPILMEDVGPGPYPTLPDVVYMLAAPCVSAYAIPEQICYIALQENGFTQINIQETEDYFLAPCIGQ